MTRTITPIQPPVAVRDEDNVLYVGAAPPGWNKDIPRQSDHSIEPLVDPPVPISDPYGWMRDETRSNEQVLEHLQAENSYTEELLKDLEPLRQTLYENMIATIQETDYTTPRPYGPFRYYTRTVKGQSYSIHCRAPAVRTAAAGRHKAASATAKSAAAPVTWDGLPESPILPDEEVILNVNQLAMGQSYCSLGAIKASPSHNLLAYSVDFTGDEVCELYVKDLRTDTIVDHDPTVEISGNLVWGDERTLFYTTMDAAHRPYQVYRRTLGSAQADEMLLEEPNDLYWMGIAKSLDGKYLFVELATKETSEIHFLDLTLSDSTLQCIAKRRPQVLYDVEHKDGSWWISSNVGWLPNLALLTSPAVADSQDAWELVVDNHGKPLFDGGYERSLSHITCFQNHVVASGREGGLPQVWIMNGIITGGAATTVRSLERLVFAEDAYDVGLGVHYEFDSETVVVTYDSLVTPTQSIEIDMTDTTRRTVLKEKYVPNYDKSLYGCQRTTVRSRDGETDIPISLVYRKDVMKRHRETASPVHVHLYGYGSYGACMEADFRATRLALLNRGMVYVIAHIRGGGEMGRQWYEEPDGGKYLCKKNTFNDFVDVARWFVNDAKLTTPDLLSCEGRSAGGMLIGCTINQAPELFKAAILGVPFVDVVCTMTDASIPLTAVEWEEWGNPNEQKYFEYMMDYCPMNNVRHVKYPSCLLTGGLNDPRVQYWEISKFAATLRHGQHPDSGPVCVKVDMSAGHFSASDRYKYLRELSFDYAFLLDQVGLADK